MRACLRVRVRVCVCVAGVKGNGRACLLLEDVRGANGEESSAHHRPSAVDTVRPFCNGPHGRERGID